MTSPFQTVPVSRYSPIRCNSRYVGCALVAGRDVERRHNPKPARILDDSKLYTPAARGYPVKLRAGKGWLVVALLLMLTSMALGGKVLEMYDAPPEMWIYAAGLLAFGWVTLSVALHTRKQYSEGEQQ